jgi:peptidoglycan/xylan/chitin deacetylase (PgdA/CDA1 family)
MLNLTILASIPIIAYHKISNKQEFGLTTVSPSMFKKQVHIINESGFFPVTFNDVLIGRNLPKKPIIITFDDGYESVHEHALPIMLNHGFKGIVYIVTDYIGRCNTWEAVSWQQKYTHLSAQQILDLHHQGFEIGSHGKSHQHLSVLPADKVLSEVRDSKKFLEDLIGQKIISFCYPYGRHTKRVKSLLGDAGYIFAIQNLNLFRKQKYDPLAMMRRSIYQTDSEKKFRCKLNQPYQFSLHKIEESLIQKGALLSIAINRLKKYSM